MPRVLRDRYFSYDQRRACDLSSGEEVQLSDVEDREPPIDERGLSALTEILEHGREGEPRWLIADAPTGAHARRMARRAAAAARYRGFVAVRVDLYHRFRDVLDAEMADRALLLIGEFGGASLSGRAALVAAAAVSPRPHVLLTFRDLDGGPRSAVVKEARAVYGARVAPPSRASTATHSEVARHLARAERAEIFAADGRHAAAARLLRDVAGALERRTALVEAADTYVRLGRLLLARGRAASAREQFGAGAQLASRGGAEDVAAVARTWQAMARIDEGCLVDAESLVRAVLLTTADTSAARGWTQHVLAWCLLLQERFDEAAAALPPSPAEAMAGQDWVAGALGDDIAVQVLVATSRHFEAGQRARRVLDQAGLEAPLASAIAHTALLRVRCTVGDLVTARESLDRVITLARRAHAPLQVARARLVWLEALRQAGCSKELERVAAHLRRVGPVAPPMLRRVIEGATALGRTGRIALPASPHSSAISTAALVRLVQEEDDDLVAIRKAVEHSARTLQTSRIDLVSTDGGPATSILAVGHGLATTLGTRVLESGLVLGCIGESDEREAGVPIRLGSRLLGALVCRWPVDRRQPTRTREILDMVAAVTAPRFESLLARARERSSASIAVPELVGVSGVIDEVRRALVRAARAPFCVLIEGESGVGKELAARAIHLLGPRRERRFCDVNCAALPDELLESELFGHARGAFTGAVADRAGLFEDADGGTLFLDEVADLSSRAQAKLLRVVQQQQVRRVGETFSRAVDVRLVAAANRDMADEAASGRFRQDLLYRLDVIRVRIPPLRERPEDVPVLAAGFWRAAASRVGSSATLTAGTLAALSRYRWPGNVRELQNVIAALAVAAPSRGRVQPSLLPAAIGAAETISSLRLADARDQFERRFVEAALARAGGSRTRTAVALGLSRQGLAKTMARLGVAAPAGSALLSG